MPLVYVTGVSGSGKSTICDELVHRGYDAHDSDRNGNASFVSRYTGERLVPASLKGRTREFVAEFEWRFERLAVERLAARAMDHTVFFCGIAANEAEIWDLFDRAICLSIDERTLRFRIASRTGNDYGQSDEELAQCLEWRKEIDANAVRHGLLRVEATKSLDEVVDEIIGLSS